MHIITQKRVWDAKREFPTAANALEGWYRVIHKNRFSNFAELKQVFGSVDKVGNLYVFDIRGNELRLVANIHFNRQKVYVRNILTHKEYDKGHWRQ